MRKVIAIVVLIGLSFCLLRPASAGEELLWQQKINKAGVQVSTRRVAGSPVLEFKGEVIVNAPLAQVVAFYEDPLQLPRWFYQCVDFQIVSIKNSQEQIFYFVIHLPWPVAERDAVFKRVKSMDATSGAIIYTLSALPDRLPQRKDRVRTPYLKTQWVFMSQGDGSTKVLFQQHSDAGGSIPAFIVNKLVVDIPFNSLKNLRRLIENQKN